MQLTKEMINSIPFKYAYSVSNEELLVGQKIRLAVKRFFDWVKTADKDGYYLDHKAGMHIIDFYSNFLNHTKGKLQGQPFILQPFQQFTMYNVFAWKDKNGNRRINTVYDKRAKKNGKSAEMAGLALYCLSFDMEMEAEVYVGATKEDQARICWNAAKQFIESPVANPLLKEIGFYVRQRVIGFKPTSSIMSPLGGDSKTQDGINSHLSIIDEYHAHKDDSVKENLESSSVQRRQPITWHITTAGTNMFSVCKNYEDSVIEILEGRKKDNSLWIMIHDLDEGDDWEYEKNWYKANPLLQSGALDITNLKKEFTKAKNQPSKIPNFKTKHLNMWVDAPEIWIPNEIWQRNIIKEVPISAFQENGSYSAIDLSSTTDLTADAFISEPDKNGIRYLKWLLYCPEATIEKRSKEDRVPYRYWRDQGYLIATPGEVCDYSIIEANHISKSSELNILRTELDKWNATSTATNLMEAGLEVSYFSQAISNMSFPTKQFEKMIYEGTIKYEHNPVIEWMLSGCVKVEDPNANVKIHKGKSHQHGKRVDGIIASIMALGGSLSMKEPESKYSKPMSEEDIII
jgi:phage terminase large subunit-like protein